ncbi:MAG: PKD domain-containing protein, partial [Planctomycetota bacterium]
MNSSFFVKKWGLVAGLLLAINSPAVLSGADTLLDIRRLDTLKQYDAWQTLGPEDPAYATPNFTLPKGTHQSKYQAKALATFGLVQQGVIQGPVANIRLQGANKLLRYTISRWPANGPGDVIGQYAGGWNHRERNMGVRLYYLYRHYPDPDNDNYYMEQDIRDDFDQRMGWAVDWPYDQSSENIKSTTNSLIFLAHEATGSTDPVLHPSYANVKSWWVDKLRSYGNEGFFEWGSVYNGWTLGAILNLAEFAEDDEVRTLARMVLDYTFGLKSGFSINGYFNSAAVRQYGYWSLCPFVTDSNGEMHHYDTETQTDIIHTLFFRKPPLFNVPPDGHLNDWVEWAASNYRPLSLIKDMYLDNYNSETCITNADRWHMYSYVMNHAAITTHITLANQYYVGGANDTHDIVQCAIQSRAGATNHVMTYPVHPNTSHVNNTQKMRSYNDRSFGYRNMAIVSGGGFTKRAWSGYYMENVPIRLFYSKDFSTVEFDSGWAFLTDGNIYVAWAPTIGDPIPDPDSLTFTDPTIYGSWLRSDYPPDDGGTYNDGEVAVVEVGDQESFGSYEAFKIEILNRNTRPRWKDEKVVYTARDGSVIEFGTSYAKVNDYPVNLWIAPRAFSTLGINNHELSVYDRTIRFDFNREKMYGDRDRLAVTNYYGPTPEEPVAVISADPTSGSPPLTVQFDGSGSYDFDGVIVSYEWDFDDNGVVDDANIETSHMYASGTYTCRLTVTDDEGNTGTATFDIYVTRSPRDFAAYIEVEGDIPDTMRAGETIGVEVTMENTGSTTWRDIEGYRLGAVDDWDPFAYARQYLDFEDAVKPEDQKTFSFDMTAPMVANTYITDWQMLREPDGWFGETCEKTVTVEAIVYVDLGTADDEHGLNRVNVLAD